jgi:hypothetical protein
MGVPNGTPNGTQVTGNVRGVLKRIEKNGEFIKLMLAVLMTSD